MTETGDPGPRRNDPPPPRPESPIQSVQGWYYVIAGLSVALLLSTLQSVTGPRTDLPNLWIARVFGLAAACVGVVLIVAAKRMERNRATIGLPMVLAVILALLDTVGIATGALPMFFLLDIGMELGFLAWWLFELYATSAPAEEEMIRAPAQALNHHR